MKTLLAFLRAFPAIVLIIERIIDAWYASRDEKAQKKLDEVQAKRAKILEKYHKNIEKAQTNEEKNEVYKQTLHDMFNLRKRM